MPSFHRRRPRRPPIRSLLKGPSGRALCRWCHQEVPKGHRSFCGKEECVHEWRIRSDAEYVRSQVFGRDHGVCTACGFDTEKAHRIWSKARWVEWEGKARRKLFAISNLMPADVDSVIREAWGITKPFQSWWEAHHVVAVVEGGGLCGLDGYETLCQGCHRTHTAALRRRMAAHRGEKHEPQS